MQKTTFGLVTVAALGLSACGDTDIERGLSGAAIGGVSTAVVGGNIATGAIVGGAVGALCDDITPELCR
jgi:hypothetical protein